MIEDLKRQKQAQQQNINNQKTPTKTIQSFVKHTRQGSQQVESDQFIQGKDNNNSSPYQQAADHTAIVFQTSPGTIREERSRSPYLKEVASTQYDDTYEDMKKKKIEALKNEIMNEQHQQYPTQSQNNDRISSNDTNRKGIMKTKTDNSSTSFVNTNPKEKSIDDSFPFNHSSNKSDNGKRTNAQQNNSRGLNKTPLTAQQKTRQQANKHQAQTTAPQRQFPKYKPVNNDSHNVSTNQLYDNNKKHNFNTNLEDNRNRSTNNLMVGQKQQRDISQNTRNTQQQLSSTLSQKQLRDKSDNTRQKQQLQQQQQQFQTQQSNQQAQLSEKTQQIFFKRLQKDVENSIRQADSHEKGGLDIEEFKQCFFLLDYLPFIQTEEAQQNQTKTLDYTYQNTIRNMILQEKEFVYNLWSILNPLNNNYIDNALLYDVLLLLIYNVKSPITVTSNFLNEYLENLYREEHIDLDSFANYNSGSSLGQRYHTTTTANEDTLTNLDKYLSFNNLWSVEKLAIEFKQMHANKVSNKFSQKQRSPSPINTGGVQINFDDGRKYKKQVIDDHLAQCTFSPNLGSKTKQIDSQLTQRLIQETQHIQRDASTDRLATRPYQSKNPHDLLQEFDQNAAQNLKRYELLYYRQQLTDQKIEKAKENLVKQELEECTFKPIISNPNHKSYSNLQRQADQIFKDLSQKIKTQKLKLDQSQVSKQEKELEECTFKPQIKPLNPKKFAPKDQVPKGYYEQINRMRKVNEEKKALEEKQQKKAIGENYDKLKLMNLKPPSFVVEGERKKRKLLMYVDVNITQTKTGRIGIYEGDDVRDLAKNFQRAFQLNGQMLHLLTLQLETHLRAYKEKHGIKDDNGYKFPREISQSRSIIQSMDDNGLQVAEEMSNEDENEDHDERDIRNRIIGYNHQSPYKMNRGDEEEDEEDFYNNTDQLNDFVRKEIERFDQLERSQKSRKTYNQYSDEKEQYISYDDSFRKKY